MIRVDAHRSRPQAVYRADEGSYHNSRDLEPYMQFLDWDMPIIKFMDFVGDYQMSEQFYDDLRG